MRAATSSGDKEPLSLNCKPCSPPGRGSVSIGKVPSSTYEGTTSVDGATPVCRRSLSAARLGLSGGDEGPWWGDGAAPLPHNASRSRDSGTQGTTELLRHSTMSLRRPIEALRPPVEALVRSAERRRLSTKSFRRSVELPGSRRRPGFSRWSVVPSRDGVALSINKAAPSAGRPLRRSAEPLVREILPLCRATERRRRRNETLLFLL